MKDRHLVGSRFRGTGGWKTDTEGAVCFGVEEG